MNAESLATAMPTLASDPVRLDISVLVLEDDALDFELLVERLRADGLSCQIHHAQDRTGFIQWLARPAPDLILSDFSLPGYDGMEALESARRAWPEVPFIFVTGALGEELAIETLRRGATDYVLKQRLDRLMPAVKRALTEADERQRRRRVEQERDQLYLRERDARREAETANMMKDEFLAMVSHELRTPLSAMLGWLRLLRTGALNDEKRQRALDIIERNARVQSQLVEDLLDVSRIVAGKVQLEMATVDLAAVVSAAVESLWPAARAKDVQLHLEHDGDARPVVGDSDRLQQVVWNLVSNAIKFTPARGNVTIRVRQDGSAACIVVSDDGEGISAAFLPYVFDRFRQAESDRRRRHGGLGLGLAIVQNLVQLHGGRVCVESAGVGRGAIFTVTLPTQIGSIAAHRMNRSAQAGVPAVLPLGTATSLLLTGIRVLVVDDETDARELLSTALEQYGATVETAVSTREALRLIAAAPPDVLVSDIGMPTEDGYQLMRQVQARAQEGKRAIPALALTAYARYEDRTEALAAGFDQHIAKPVEPQDLALAIKRLVGRQRA